MSKTKTHKECRLESCCCCGGKVKPESGRSKITPISEKLSKEFKRGLSQSLTWRL